MTKRYYLCTVELREIGGDMSYIPVVADHGVPFSSVAPTDAPTWALAIAKADDHGPLLADARLTPLPNFSLDYLVAAMLSSDLDPVIFALGQLNLDASFIATATTFRDIVRGIGQFTDPAFDETLMDVA